MAGDFPEAFPAGRWVGAEVAVRQAAARGGKGEKMRYLIGLAALVMVGCASSSKTYTADGREGYSLNCSGLARNWGHCLEKAGELCGAKGYDVLAQSGDSGAIVTATTQSVQGGSVINRSMIVACKR
jgi:hypothetical protein